MHGRRNFGDHQNLVRWMFQGPVLAVSDWRGVEQAHWDCEPPLVMLPSWATSWEQGSSLALAPGASGTLILLCTT